jgi:hypothetical protein
MKPRQWAVFWASSRCKEVKRLFQYSTAGWSPEPEALKNWQPVKDRLPHSYADMEGPVIPQDTVPQGSPRMDEAKFLINQAQEKEGKHNEDTSSRSPYCTLQI